MSTIKISELPEITHLDTNTANTVFVGVSLTTSSTGKFTATTLAEGLYSHNALNVGNNAILLPNTIAQFTANSDNYIQVNLQNPRPKGTSDYVITSDVGTDTSNYIDYGITNSQYDVNNPYNSLGTSIEPLSGYIYVKGNNSGGNLIIGTTSTNTEIRFIAGGINSENVITKIDKTGLSLQNSGHLKFSDSTIQTTASVPANYSQSAYAFANTVNSYSYSANSWLQSYTTSSISSANNWLQSNDAITLSSAKSYTDSANSWLQSNDATTLSSAKSYTDSANSWLQTYAVQNTSSIIIPGDLTGSNGTITANNLHFATELVGTSSALIRTSSGINNSKNISIVGGNDLGGYAAGSITITGGNSTAINGTGGNITLTPGIGNTTNGIVQVDGNINVSKLVSIKNSNVTDNSVFLLITGAANNAHQPPSNPGYTIHTTSIDGQGNRVTADAFGAGANNYSSFIARRGRGTAASPTAIQNGDVIARFAGNGFGTTKFSQYGDGRIEVVAVENFTDTSKRTRIDFYTTESGSNSATVIATFNGSNATFTGVVNPQKGFIYTPNVVSSNVTSYNIDIANNSLYKLSCNNNLSLSLSDFQYGKVVEVWLTNTSGSTRTITHGCSAINSTTNSTTFTIPSSSSAYIKYFSIDGDLANTFVSINHP